MNFLRGVMGGQSAGPQHTEAETVRGARWVRDLGRVRAGTGRRIRGLEVTSRAPPWAGGPHAASPVASLPLLKPRSYSLSPPAQPPPRRSGRADRSRAPELRRPGVGGGPPPVPPGKGSILRAGGSTCPLYPRGLRALAAFSCLERNLKCCCLRRSLEWGMGGCEV